MSSPIGHLLLGVLFYQIIFGRKTFNYRWFFLCIFVSVLPDFDIILGPFFNRLYFHQTFSHTLGLAIITGLIFSLILRERLIKNFVYFSGIYYSHILLDFLASGSDSSFPFGIPLLWPIDSEFYALPFTILSDIWRGTTTETFLPGMINMHNLWTISIELAIFIPMNLAVYYFKKSRS